MLTSITPPPARRAAAWVLPVVLIALVGGCARYEFDVIQPADQRVHVGRKQDAVVRLDPLEYRMRAVEGRLVMHVHNPTQDTVVFLGERSTVVDTRGQSHPLRGQTIAPGSFVKLIVPPMRPRVYRSGPSFGIGVGVGVHNSHPHHYRSYSPYYRRRAMYYDYFDAYDPWLDEPVYLTVYDDADAYYWDWDGEGEARLHLLYQRGRESEPFEHLIVLYRSKVK